MQKNASLNIYIGAKYAYIYRRVAKGERYINYSKVHIESNFWSKMSGSDSGSGHSTAGDAPPGTAVPIERKKEKARVSRTSLILWHAHQNDAVAVRKLLEEDPNLVHAKDYDNRTPLHVAALHGLIDVAKTLIEFGADVNAQDRWKNTVNLSTL